MGPGADGLTLITGSEGMLAALPSSTVLIGIGAVVAVLAAAVPTPGGLGAVEAALIAGMSGAGIPYGVAISVTVLYRLIT